VRSIVLGIIVLIIAAAGVIAVTMSTKDAAAPEAVNTTVTNTQHSSEIHTTEPLYTTSIFVGDIEIFVDIADTSVKRMQGLSGRAALTNETGMLFVFEELVRPRFWMKDMNFSIDIIWISSDKQIVGIERDVSPESFPQTFSPSEPVLYVLEVPAGWAQSNGIILGTQLSSLP
jgi:uncharacterized membrane protein (UPF0127 family)